MNTLKEYLVLVGWFGSLGQNIYKKISDAEFKTDFSCVSSLVHSYIYECVHIFVFLRDYCCCLSSTTTIISPRIFFKYIAILYASCNKKNCARGVLFKIGILYNLYEILYKFDSLFVNRQFNNNK